VAQLVTDYLIKNNSRYDKAIFFCVDIEHAERMRKALVNANPDLAAKNSKYVMRITGDNDEGKKELDNFIDPESTYPVLVTTSKLMTTGVDAQTCKLIVLDSIINSMTEFKQIIGRGTRIREDYNKYYFTIIDFRSVTKLFADPAFDGDPVKIKETSGAIPSEEEQSGEYEQYDDTVKVEDYKENSDPNTYDPDGGKDKPRKYYVGDVEVKVLNQRVMYYGKDGKLITQSLEDYTRSNIKKDYTSLNEFLRKWNASQRKTAILEEFREQGILLEELQEKVGKDLDPFDLICHVVFDWRALTRKERVEKVKKRNYFTQYGEQARAVLVALLDKYADEGVDNLESMDVLKVPPMDKFGSPLEIVRAFGGKQKYLQAINELEQEIYSA